MIEKFSTTKYLVRYVNKRREQKVDIFSTRDAAEVYFQEKVDMGYKPRMYSETATVETKLIRK